MIADGKKLSEEIKTSLTGEVLKLTKQPRLAVIQAGADPVALKFLEQKKKFGNAVGIDLRIYYIEENISTAKLREKVSEVVHVKENTGVIIQLPLPSGINTQYILDALTPEKDPDMLSSKSIGLFSSGRSKILPPVVGAVKYIFEKNNIELRGKSATVVGAGRLVGRPMAVWLTQMGATVTIVDENTADPALHTLDADIVISGAGLPHFIKDCMVKKGAVVIDCGTSECNGKLAGDVDPAVAEKASLFTPVPGGVGPLTVAMLFKNLVELAKKK